MWEKIQVEIELMLEHPGSQQQAGILLIFFDKF
jgi:hypothetical protein